MLRYSNLVKKKRSASLVLPLLLALSSSSAFSKDETDAASKVPYKGVEKLRTHGEEFHYLDLNNDGVVSLSESKSEYALSNAFATVDRDGNNEISLVEYRDYYHVRYGSIANTKPLKHLNSEERAKNSFSRYDENEDGYISIHEFSEMTGKGSDGIPDENQKKPSGVTLKGHKYDPDPTS